jgi:transcriptional regulator with PAS, ATPase and Fis domain
MRRVDEIVDCVAATDATVLIWGESGVGKELVARALHQRSSRRDRPFVKVNCAALPADLLESELFGYERGAFTGASRRKLGKFEQAHTGTIFLDEISELPLPLQAKLLHVLQDHRFSRLGGQQEIRVDVRVVTATNRDLSECVAHGEFREDLYFRLNVVAVFVPPLRERPEEIPILVDHFLALYSEKYGRELAPLPPAILERFKRYSWPGNVRQLQNIVQRLVVLGADAVMTELDDAARLRAAPPRRRAPAADTGAEAGDDSLGLKDLVRQVVEQAERTALTRMLERVRWRRVEAARRLRISYKTLLDKIKHYKLERPAS